MSKIKLTISVLALFLAFCQKGLAQQFDINPVYYTIFDQDSLSGFDENEARNTAIRERFLGSEFKIKMYRLKREYINNKYDLTSNNKNNYQNSYFLNSPLMGAKPVVVPGCVNEDFEATVAGVITSSSQVAGWSVVEGYNGFLSPGDNEAFPNGLNNPNSCNLQGCCPLPPSHSEIIDCSAPGGYIDNTIGSQYPIYSVFGTGTVSGAVASNSQITQGMFGTKVLRLNDEITGDYSMGKLAKTFSVSSQNALFQFAFISVFAPGHGCCDAGGFQIKLYQNGQSPTGTPTTITCPSFSVSAPSSACTATVPMTYYIVQSWTPNNANNFNNIYNPWKISSMDLSSYIGKYITIEIIVSDCNAGGHFGCVYFDAQCGPMTVIGNGQSFDAGANVTVPTCGASGATICAADGLGPFSWAGPNLTADQGVPSMTNQCITTTVSSSYTLYMQPQGACTPIQRVVQSSITPAPLLLVSANQAQCNDSDAVVTVTPSGSAANPSSLIWSPTPLSLNQSTTQGTYYVPPVGGSTQTMITVTAADPLGCKVTATVNLNPAPPVPSFTIMNVTNSASITCNTPSVDLASATNYTYGTMNYFWASNSATYTGANINVTGSGSIVVIGTDPITNCQARDTISIFVNTVTPTSNVGPLTQNISCVTQAANVTVTATSPTVNVSNYVISPTSPQTTTFVSTSPVVQFPPSPPGNYTVITMNDVTGCFTTKIFTVTSSDVFPTFGLQSPQHFTLGCSSKSVATINVVDPQDGNGGGGVHQSILAPGVTSPTYTTGTQFFANVPGTYTIMVQNNSNGCTTSLPFSVISNTLSPDKSVTYVRNYVDCFTPTITLHGKSTTSDVKFWWTTPGIPNTYDFDTLLVQTNPTAPTNSVVGNYTLNVENISSTCRSTSVVTMYQNLYTPIARAAATPTALTCKQNTVTLTNNSLPTVPSSTVFQSTGIVVAAIKWQGPSPQAEQYNSTNYLAATPGVYTITSRDMSNGCTNTGTINIDDGRIFPSLIMNTGTLSCGSTTAVVSVSVANFNTNLTYSWRYEGTLRGPTGSPNLSSFVVPQTGTYYATVTNTINGCGFTSSTTVVSDSLDANFEADVYTGFAPLTVNFKNLSSSTTGASSISAIWDMGNGTFTNSAISGSASVVNTKALYNQPGTYTVTLYVNKGECLEKVTKIIQVEIPSSLTIPNIFTPNGDGVNDIYFVKASNLSNIDIVIYDRWGHVVYKITSDTGNISWDGKNQFGKDSAEGTYYYVLKGSGSDGTSFNEKGTISLMR